jgi:hypothetical protein
MIYVFCLFCLIFLFFVSRLSIVFLEKSPISHPEKWGFFQYSSEIRLVVRMKSYMLSLAHPGLDLSAYRAELSVINTLFLLSPRDVIPH